MSISLFSMSKQLEITRFRMNHLHHCCRRVEPQNALLYSRICIHAFAQLTQPPLSSQLFVATKFFLLHSCRLSCLRLLSSLCSLNALYFLRNPWWRFRWAMRFVDEPWFIRIFDLQIWHDAVLSLLSNQIQMGLWVSDPSSYSQIWSRKSIMSNNCRVSGKIWSLDGFRVFYTTCKWSRLPSLLI